MVGDPFDLVFGPGYALHAGHHADGGTRFFQHWALFDVQFEIGPRHHVIYRHITRIANTIQFTANTLTIRADRFQSLGQRQRALVHGAAHHVRCKAGTFLVGEKSDRDGMPGRDPGIVQGVNGFQSRQYTERTVIKTTGGNGINV